MTESGGKKFQAFYSSKKYFFLSQIPGSGAGSLSNRARIEFGHLQQPQSAFLDEAGFSLAL